MISKNTIVLAGSVLLSISLCSLSLPQQQQHEKAKNLKVLPKNMSHEAVDSVMKGFKDALGVRCNYCHTASKEDPKKMDFASDDSEHKKIAREMMRMTQKLNKKYFDNDQTMSVTCYTCHRGNKDPLVSPQPVK